MEKFTITEAYRLGDEFYRTNKLIAAEACYAFAEMKPLPMPQVGDAPVDANKLSNLIKYRKSINHPLPSKGKGKGTDIPPQCLKMIQAFYNPWLQQIKPDMSKRSDEHAQRRMKGVIEVFEVVTHDKLGHLVLDDIAKANHLQQIDKIKNWNGPSFGKFQIRDNQKMKNNFSLSRLTVVLDFKNYRKRCRNSQEDWFKAIDGKFFAQCLNKVYQIFVDKFPDERQREFMGIVFLKFVLDKYIQFPSASAKLLVPAGTIFANKTGQELREIIHEFHPNVNPLAIKQQAQTRSVKVLHKRLMKIVNEEYSKVISQMDNPLSLIPSKQSSTSPQQQQLQPPSISEVPQQVQQQRPMMIAQDSYDSNAHDSSNDDEILYTVHNAGDIDMELINRNHAENGINNQYSFNNGSQSDTSSVIQDEDDEGWGTSLNVPYPTLLVQFPQQSNRNNLEISTSTSTSKAQNYVQPMEQQPIPYQPSQPFHFNPTQKSLSQAQATPLPKLPDNLNFGVINNIQQDFPDINPNNNDDTMTQINSGFGWDGMPQFGDNPNSSMMPLIHDDNQSTFQPLPSSVDLQQPLPCESGCTCHLGHNQNEQSMQQDQQQHQHEHQSMLSQPKSHLQHGVNYCDCEFCKGFGSNQSITPSLTTPSEITQINTPSVIGSEVHTPCNSFMHDNAPYRSIQLIPQKHEYQYSSRQSSPATISTCTPSQGHNNNNMVITNPFRFNQQQQQQQQTNLNAFSNDTFENDYTQRVTNDICTGCFESQCKCNSIAMNRRYNKQFQNTNTFNTRNNRIHHQNIQSINTFNNNDRKQRRQLHIQQLNNMRENSVNLMNNNYNNWNTTMNVRTY